MAEQDALARRQRGEAPISTFEFNGSVLRVQPGVGVVEVERRGPEAEGVGPLAQGEYARLQRLRARQR